MDTLRAVTITGKVIPGRDGRPSRRKRWYAVADYGRDTKGKRVRKWSRSFDSEADAKAHRDHLLRQRPGVMTQGNNRSTLAAFVEVEWLPAAASTLRPSTLASYRRNLEHHITPTLGHLKLTEIDPPRLNALYGELLASGKRTGEGGLSPRTVRYVHTILHRVLRDAVRWDRLTVNPADRADPPRAGADARPHDMKTWGATDVSKFLAASRKHKGRGGSETVDRLYPAWVLLLTTGIRRGELLGLRWTDLELDAQQLAVRQTLVDVPQGGQHTATFSVPKTAAGRRNVALDSATVAVLRAHKADQAAERLAAGETWEDSGLVFTTRIGAPLNPERFSREFTRRVAAYGLPPIRLHDLRHTHASLGLQRGVNLKVMSERLGHANISITGDVYAHVTPTMQAEAAEAVAGLFMGS